MLGLVGYFVGAAWSPIWNFSYGENIAHIVLGVVMLAVVYWSKDANLMKWLTVLVGVVALYFAVYGFAVSSNYYNLGSLETLDNVAHLVIGVWGLWIVWGKKK